MWHRFSLALLACLLCVAPDASARGKKRTRYFELQPMAGYSLVHLTGFSEDQFVTSLQGQAEASAADLAAGGETSGSDVDVGASLADAQQSVRGSGPSAGLAAQLKLWIFVLGGRYNYTHTPGFDLHTAGGDLGFRLGSTVAFYSRLGAGFAGVTGLPDPITTRGLYAEAAGGLDVRVAEAISFGLGLDLNVLILSQEFESAQNLANGTAQQSDFSNLDGSALGFQVRPQLHLTWHI